MGKGKSTGTSKGMSISMSLAWKLDLDSNPRTSIVDSWTWTNFLTFVLSIKIIGSDYENSWSGPEETFIFAF